MRHLGEVGDYWFAGNVFAHRNCQHGGVVVVDLRATDFGETHDLAFRVGQLQAHQAFAGNRLHHPHRYERQGARQILRQPDNLAALHAGGGFDFVARDHRAGIRRFHFSLYAKILQLFFDQA